MSFLLYVADGEVLHASPVRAGCVFSDSVEALSLDLSPPTVTDGWPDRIDGYVVAASMLARAMGLCSTDGCQWYRDPAEDGWRLATQDGWVRFVDRAAYRSSRLVGVPSLATIGPADPLADRLALAAVMRAAPWRTE